MEESILKITLTMNYNQARYLGACVHGIPQALHGGEDLEEFLTTMQYIRDLLTVEEAMDLLVQTAPIASWCLETREAEDAI
jgi:HEPN domain-containing protein